MAIPENEERFPSNSYVGRTSMDEGGTKRTKDVQPVVKGKVSVGKKSLSEKFRETFLVEDLKSVGENIVFDMLIPAIKDTFVSMVEGSINMMFYGDRRGSRTIRDRDRSYVRVSYDRCYDDRRSRRRRDEEGPVRVQNQSMVHQLLFDDRGDAEEVLSGMVDLIDEFDVASVKDLYRLARLETDYTKETYGWYNLSEARIESTRRGWLLKLPKPVVLD